MIAVAVLLLLGLFCCAWSLFTSGTYWDANGPHMGPSFAVGLGWFVGGIIAWLRFRRRGSGPEK
jgi:hypothetical protein